MSILKIHRNPETCTDCQNCTRSCPVNIKVHKNNTVFSDECHACFKCVESCPEKNTLFLSITRNAGRISVYAYAAFLVMVFIFGISLARMTGVWHNNISNEEYRFHLVHMGLPMYQHNRGVVPDKEEMRGVVE